MEAQTFVFLKSPGIVLNRNVTRDYFLDKGIGTRLESLRVIEFFLLLIVDKGCTDDTAGKGGQVENKA